MSGDYVLAIDQGTTGTTVILFDHQSNIVGKVYQEFTQYYPRPGWVEHDAAEIWEGTVQLLMGFSARQRWIQPSDGHWRHQPAGNSGPLGSQDG